jgi:hypothetical protein
MMNLTPADGAATSGSTVVVILAPPGHALESMFRMAHLRYLAVAAYSDVTNRTQAP